MTSDINCFWETYDTNFILSIHSILEQTETKNVIVHLNKMAASWLQYRTLNFFSFLSSIMI